jgi:hypothetical protein
MVGRRGPQWAVESRRGLTAVSGVARPQGEQPATIFYLFGHFMPYAYAITTRNLLAEVTILCSRVWGVQVGRRQLQVACLVSRLPLKWPYGRFKGDPLILK